MDVVQISPAAMPILLSLASRTAKVIAPCLLASIFTVVLGAEPRRAVMAWCAGMLIAAVALRERLRTKLGGRAAHPQNEKARRGEPRRARFLARWSRAESAPMPSPWSRA